MDPARHLRHAHIAAVTATLIATCQFASKHIDTHGVIHHPALQIDKNVEREILVHSQLQHPNIVGFKRAPCSSFEHQSTSL